MQLRTTPTNKKGKERLRERKQQENIRSDCSL
jgi:hypothetical protein